MKTITSAILVSMLAAMLLTGCGGGETEPPAGMPGSPAEPLPPTDPVPPTDPTGPSNPTTPRQPVTPTAVGTVQGAAASAQIGPAGGVLTSFDGYLTLTVPAGAFDSARQVIIEPISNLAHGARGPAYRISPEGLNTPVPMTLTFKVDPVTLRGTALDALTIATQDADGRWTGTRTPQRNATAATVSVQASHFSDWGLIAGVQLYPATVQVAIEESLDLKIIRCPWVEPRVHNVAGFTRGNLPVDLRFGLVGLEYMPPRLAPDAAGTFFPGGLGVGLVADGYASEENAGKGMVRWNVTR